jgi:hypothetical protein
MYVACIYMRTYVCTIVTTYINSLGPCVTETLGCGTSHKYTKMHIFYDVKYKCFIKRYH